MTPDCDMFLTGNLNTVYVTKDEVEQINLAVVYGGVQMYLIAE